MNDYDIDTDKIQAGDRVEVLGATQVEDERHLGTIISKRKDQNSWNVRMDDANLYGSFRYGGGNGNPKSYWAMPNDITQHLPAAVEEPHVCRPMMPPMPYTDPRLGKVAADINETLRYLWDRTGSEWVAETDGIQLDLSAAGDYAGTMHVKFIKKEIE